MSNSSIWLIDRTPSGVNTPGQSGPGSNGNQRVFHIPQSSNITEAAQSDCLVSYPGCSLGESYPSSVILSAYSTAPADLTTRTLVEGVLPLFSDIVGVFYSSSRLDHQDTRWGSLTPQQWYSRRILLPQPTGYSERRAIAENFCCSNTLPLLVKSGKVIQVSVLILLKAHIKVTGVQQI